MKYSIVIPTRNRLALLEQCVFTILDQSFQDWEMIVSDNFSDEDIGGWIKSINDPRIKYFRTHEFLSVTKNWNNCIEKASGDYILMLGDDDGLAPDYFLKLEEILTKFKKPSVIYNSCYRVIAPGILDQYPNGYLADEKYAFFFEGRKKPFWLSKNERTKAYAGSLKLKRNFSFNMQAFIFSNQYVRDRLEKGTFFNSTFPDYYVANVAMLKADSVLVIPESLTIAGTAKQSFGGSLLSGRAELDGKKMLNIEAESERLPASVKSKIITPGPYYLNNYMLTMAQFLNDYSKDIHYSLNFNRYKTKIIYEQLIDNPSKINLGLVESLKKGQFCQFFALLQNLKSSNIFLEKVCKQFSKYINIYAYLPRVKILKDEGIGNVIEAYNFLKSCK